ncbi:MAG: valine--tRNA ligase [Candidatus Micrarchaeota archaeon]|nr:valine--tRNA ligase [Candidatus Micrarchaeota archaeon]
MLDEYAPHKFEEKMRKKWEELKLHEFDEKSKRKVFIIDTPPPFPTGEFHIGNTLNWCYMDFVARYKRMCGYNVLFPQGWDCHGFPTEVKVEKKYGRLPREQFKEKCLEWTRDVISTMKPQMKEMGFSIDWRQEYYTIDKEYHRKVQYSILKMFEKGLVYRSKHPVLWCTCCGSAIAKAETDEIERETALNYISFSCEGKPLVIATTRPELLHACVAVLVNPEDGRYKQLHGKTAVVPLFNREVKIIPDSEVDPSFGTGIVMVCTFGDKQDVTWSYRHNLPVIEAMDGRGKLLNAGKFTGLKAELAREKILEELNLLKLITKKEKLKQMVKIHDRCKRPVEFLNSAQWFMKLKGHEEEIMKAANEMRWVPSHTIQLLIDWCRGLEWDWCFSRQRIFGIPIPFWYCEKCDCVIAPGYPNLPVDPARDKPPVKNCPKCEGKLIGETSICDGWVDSSITPLVIGGWPDDEKKFTALYPSSLRPQGTDIIRTWAFYTIYRCLMLTGKPCFKDVLINGMVCGSDGKKMSKSLGNYVEAKDVIKKSSVDSLRMWAALSGSTGKDNIFYWKDVNYAHSFLNKLWNASKFIEFSLKESDGGKQKLRVTDRWILSRLNKVVETCTNAFENYDFYTAITTFTEFFWHEFCDYYLEEVKHRLYQPDKYGTESRRAAQSTLKTVLLTSLKLTAPFAAYTIDELYQQLFSKEESIHAESWPKEDKKMIDEESEQNAMLLNKVLSEIRKFKMSQKLSLNTELSSAKIKVEKPEQLDSVKEEIEAAGRIKKIEISKGEFKVELKK